MTTIPGYRYGADLTASPVGLGGLDLLLETLLWTDDDAAALSWPPTATRTRWSTRCTPPGSRR